MSLISHTDSTQPMHMSIHKASIALSAMLALPNLNSKKKELATARQSFAHPYAKSTISKVEHAGQRHHYATNDTYRSDGKANGGCHHTASCHSRNHQAWISGLPCWAEPATPSSR